MKLAIVNYPNSLKSSVYGLYELFEMANSLCETAHQFDCNILTLDQLKNSECYDMVIVPPAVKGEYYLDPSEEFLDWLRSQHNQKATLCSVCAGAFILAKSGLLEGRKVTTHWGLADEFQKSFPQVVLDCHHILINEGAIVTAGGMMSWLDLGMEIVAQHLGPRVMLQLGRNLVVDTGYRAQSYYQRFVPKRNHGDQAILQAQVFLDSHYPNKIKMSKLSELCHMSERTFLRHFHQSTGFKPSEYIQRLRTQKACELLEQTKKSFDLIATEVGYEDSSACRKVFVRILGLTPKQFRQRFVKRL